MRNHKAARYPLEVVASVALRMTPLAVERLSADFRTPRLLRPKRITQMWLNKALYKASAGRSMVYRFTFTQWKEGVEL